MKINPYLIAAAVIGLLVLRNKTPDEFTGTNTGKITN